MVLLPPPQPGPLSFHLLFHDPASAHSRNLTLASGARARVRTVLKANSKAAAAGNGGDWSAAVNATTDYLPYLLAILACVESDDLLPKTEPIFTWRFSLSPQALKKARPRISLYSLQYELAATLLTHALCLANQSATMVASLGSYETSSSVSSAALKVHDETINTAAELLCRASGVLTYLSEVVLPKWETAVGEAVRGRPVELSRDVVTALAKLTLADANLLAIRRLLSRSLSVSHTTTTPGPPLPSTHPSPSLLAKLHLHVYTLYDAARSLCKTATRVCPSVGDVSPSLRSHLTVGRGVSLSLAYKWLGVDAGENGGRERAGDALVWLSMAKVGLEEVTGKGLGGLRIGKSKSQEKMRKGKLGEELDSVAAFMSAYKKVNDTVHFQKLPPAATLQTQVPAGRAALSPKPFVAPPTAFKPRASGVNVPRSVPPPPLGELDASGLSLDDSSDDDDGGGDVDDGKQYFGAGSYW